MSQENWASEANVPQEPSVGKLQIQHTQPHPESLVLPDALLRTSDAMAADSSTQQPPVSEEEEELESALAPYMEVFDGVMSKLELSMPEIFIAALACQGDLKDTEAFLTGRYAEMKRPPLPRAGLKAVLEASDWPQ